MRPFVTGLIVLAVLIIAGWATNYYLAVTAVDSANQSWCPALNALTRHPVPRPTDPAANPSRVNAYRFYLIFVAQKHRFGCVP